MKISDISAVFFLLSFFMILTERQFVPLGRVFSGPVPQIRLPSFVMRSNSWELETTILKHWEEKCLFLPESGHLKGTKCMVHEASKWELWSCDWSPASFKCLSATQFLKRTGLQSHVVGVTFTFFNRHTQTHTEISPGGL